MISITFSCLSDVTRTSSNMLNKSGKSGHPCLVPHLQGKSVFHYYDVGYGFFTYGNGSLCLLWAGFGPCVISGPV